MCDATGPRSNLRIVALLLGRGPRLAFRVSESVPEEPHRTCPQCGRDLDPEPFATESGIRIAFSCKEHGLQTVVDPFEDAR